MLPPVLAPNNVLAPSVLTLRKGPAGIETATGEHKLSVQTRLPVFPCVHLDDRAHFPPIFGWNSGGVDADRLHIVGFDLRSEAWRSIVGQRNAIHNKLCLIFRITRMKDGVSLVQPARLRVHQILNRPTRYRTE